MKKYTNRDAALCLERNGEGIIKGYKYFDCTVGTIVGAGASRRGVVLNLGCDRELVDLAGWAKSSKLCEAAGFGKVCHDLTRVTKTPMVARSCV